MGLAKWHKNSIENVTDGRGVRFSTMESVSAADYLSSVFDEIDPISFYRDLFPLGELDERDAMTKGKYCGIALEIVGKKAANRYTITDDLEPIPELIKRDNFVVISPISYAGKYNTQKNSRFLYALTFDLDGLRTKNGRQIGLENLLHHTQTIDLLPNPTYICASGNGVHLYYCLERPITLFPNVKKQVREFRNNLIPRLWNHYITELSKEPQYESFSQGFRAVGSICKDEKTRVRAFRTGGKVSIEYLNDFVDDAAKITEFSYKSKLTLREAAEKYPEWYQSRIVEGKPAGTWKIKRDLYDWWLRQIKSGAAVGHRYFCIMCLAVYAKKCNIPIEELEKDAFNLLDYLDSLSVTPDNPFTDEDIVSALNAYSDEYILLTRDAISRMSGIEITPNKRNYRKQDIHLEFARATRAIKLKVGESVAKGGATPKKDLVIDYFKNHPEKSNREIAADLGISRNTVNKWVKYYKEQTASGD